MFDRFFTIDEAERMLPEVERTMENILHTRKQAVQAGEALARLAGKMAKGENIDAPDFLNSKTEIEFLMQIIEEGVESIEGLGAVVKDLDQGLVDFPALINDEPVFLCWKYGETGIHYYHTPEGGFAGRKRLTREKPAAARTENK